jgi:hypothetical protein
LGVISRHFPAQCGTFWQILALFGQITVELPGYLTANQWIAENRLVLFFYSNA